MPRAPAAPAVRTSLNAAAVTLAAAHRASSQLSEIQPAASGAAAVCAPAAIYPAATQGLARCFAASHVPPLNAAQLFTDWQASAQRQAASDVSGPPRAAPSGARKPGWQRRVQHALAAALLNSCQPAQKPQKPTGPSQRQDQSRTLHMQMSARQRRRAWSLDLPPPPSALACAAHSAGCRKRGLTPLRRWQPCRRGHNKCPSLHRGSFGSRKEPRPRACC